MAKKNEINYFESFNAMIELAKRAATQLDTMLEEYEDVEAKAQAILETEHESDVLLHRITEELNRSFITPIEREDILEIANLIDDIVDGIEDIANLFDMFSITQVPEVALVMTNYIILAITALAEAVKEFEAYRRSKSLNSLIIEVNRIEEEGDKVFRRIVKELYSGSYELLDAIKWKEVYGTMESVLDSCEKTADALGALAIKNS